MRVLLSLTLIIILINVVYKQETTTIKDKYCGKGFKLTNGEIYIVEYYKPYPETYVAKNKQDNQYYGFSVEFIHQKIK
jgi:hypothetical protein